MLLDGHTLLPLLFRLLGGALLCNLVVVIFLLSQCRFLNYTLLSLGSLHPLHKVSDEIAELLLSLLVVEHGLLVETNRLVEPILDVLLTDCVVVQQLFQEAWTESTQFVFVLTNEVEDEGLHKMLKTMFSIKFNQTDEQVLIQVPILDNVSFGAENAAQGDVVQ